MLVLLLGLLGLVNFFSVGSVSGQQQGVAQSVTVYSSWPDQTPPAFVVLPFVDAHTGSGDTSLLITNTGLTYDLCADFYLFDPNGTMIGCCACPVKENGLLTMSVNDLTQNTLIGPATKGVIKILSSTSCVPSYPNPIYPGLKIYERNTYASFPPSPIVAVPETLLGMWEWVGLERQCGAIVKQSGNSGPGICTCGATPG